INIMLFVLIYYASPSLLGNFAYGCIEMAVSLGLAVYFTLGFRNKIGGYWSFREALGNILLLLLIQFVVVTLCTAAFAKWIDLIYADAMREITLNAATRVAEAFGSGQEQIDEMIEEAEKNLEGQVNPGLMDVVRGLALGAIFYFIGALIFAAIF